MTTFTVVDLNSGEKIGGGLTAADAAHIVLTDDSREYEIRADEDGGFSLWSRQQVANKGWTRTGIFSIKDDRTEAEAEIFDKVITADWRRYPEVMTDQQYSEMMADFEGDAE